MEESSTRSGSPFKQLHPSAVQASTQNQARRPELVRNLNLTMNAANPSLNLGNMPPPPHPIKPNSATTTPRNQPSARSRRESETIGREFGDSPSPRGHRSEFSDAASEEQSTYLPADIAQMGKMPDDMNFNNNKPTITWLNNKMDVYAEGLARHTAHTTDRIVTALRDTIGTEVRKAVTEGLHDQSRRLEAVEARISQLKVDHPNQDREGSFDPAELANASSRLRQGLFPSPHTQPTHNFNLPPEGVQLGARHNLGTGKFHDPQRHGAPSPSLPPQRDYRSQHDRHDTRDPRDQRDPRNMRDHRDPRDRYRRDDREESQETGATHGTYKPEQIRIKREDVGQFNPYYEDPENLGVVADGKSLIYTDVHCFRDRLNTFMDDPSTLMDIERQLLGLFPTLLGGAAVLWWTNEVIQDRRVTLRQAGLNAVLDALCDRFATDAGLASRNFEKGRCSLKDLAYDDAALTKHIQKMMRYARSMGTLTANNSNWEGPMMSVWTKLDLKIRQYLRPPERGGTLAEYMSHVERTRTILIAAANDHYPSLVASSSSVLKSSSSYSKADDRLSYKSSSRYPSSRENRTSSRSYTDNRSRDKSRDRYRDNREQSRERDRSHDRTRDYERDRDRRNDYNKNESQRKDDRDRRENRKPDDRYKRNDKYDKKDRDTYRRQGVHFAEEEEADQADASSPSEGSESEPDMAYFTFDASITCHKCHETFQNTDSRRRHVKVCAKQTILKHEKQTRRNEAEHRRTCGFCSEVCNTRNELFKHLKRCEDALAGNIRRPANFADLVGDSETSESASTMTPVESDSVAAFHAMPTEAFQVREAPTPDANECDGPLSGYTYLRVVARAQPEAQDIQICIDPGAGRSLIGRDYLNTLEHTIEKADGKVKGIGKKPVKITEKATFTFYLPGFDNNGEPTLMKFERSAWVMEQLDPNLLLANDFSDPYGANIDYSRKAISFAPIPNFSIPFETRTREFPCVRKVKTTQKITLMADQEAYIAVEYKPLPNDRKLLFNSSHSAALNAVINAKTPKVVMVKNPTKGVMTIPKRFPIGRIGEAADSGYLACSLSTAFKALAVGTALTALASPAMAADIDPTAVIAQGPVVSMGAEFTLDDRIRAVVNGLPETSIPTVQFAEPGMTTRSRQPMQTNSPIPIANFTDIDGQGTPLSDFVFNLTQSTPIHQDSVTDRPRVPEKHSTLGLRMAPDLPEVKTRDGVSVYAADPQVAKRFVDLCEAHVQLWTDNGLIDVPPDQLMKVPLVEGWQNQLKKTRSYPLSRKDQEVLDKTFDALHQQNKMTFATEATPFAHPVFVVWRTAKGEQKARVVIDLRGLNKVTVPDNYPLPLQADVINSLRGKRYITAVDATSFFYQFGVHPEHRDRFTLISPRGLEQPKVALMGFRNSPAYVQRFMDRLLDPHKEYCRAFIDDIVIYSDNLKDHMRHLTIIFGLFQSKNIAISPSKSFVGYPNVELLGFRVDSLGLTTTASRVAAFRNLAFPSSIKALEQYIGGASFLRHLIPYFAKLVEPLQTRKTALLALGRKEGKVVAGNLSKRNHYCSQTFFEPTEAEMLSFNAIQNAICKENPTILFHFNPDKSLFMQVDGCLERGFGVMTFHLKNGYTWEPGAIIPSAAVEPVMFLSRCLTGAESRYGPSEQEVACLVWAVRKLRTMIHSSRLPVQVLTDHSSTKGIVEQTTLSTSSTDRGNRRLINASVYLAQYDLKVHHIPGRLNFVPDALSRLRALEDTDERPEGEAILDTIWFAEAQMDQDLKNQFVEAYKEDRKYALIIKDLRETAEGSGVFLRRGLPFVLTDSLLYNIRPDGMRSLCVPHAMVKTILDSVHDEKHHFGEERMLYDIRGLAIANKTHRVKKYVKHCPSCGLNQTDRQPPIGEYQPIRPGDALPMRIIGIDFIVGLPKVDAVGTPWQLKGHTKFDSLLTVSCKSSKRSLLIPGHSTYTTEEWGSSLMRQLLLSDWGVPSGIISDRDAKFTSALWKGMWTALGTKLLMTAAYHPQADGMAERKNQTVEIAMRYWVFDNPEGNWSELVPSLQWHLNSAFSSTINSSPHEQLYGFRPSGPLEALLPASTEAKDIPVLREYLRQDAQLAMDFAAAHAKLRYDEKHRPLEFEVGDKVYLRLHKGYHLPGKPSRKLSQQRAGPFEIKKRVGRLAYELDFPPNMGIHPVISVSHLSPSPTGEDPYHRDVPPPGPINDSQSESEGDGDNYEVEIVTQHRKVRNGYKYLIKWKGWNNENNVWMTANQLRKCQDLVDEYWDRQGGKPDDAVVTESPKSTVPVENKPSAPHPPEPTADSAPAPRKRGRPRKSSPAPATLRRSSRDVGPAID